MIFTRILGIGACDPRGVMGKNGQLPWHYPEDLQHFSDTTRGSPLIMGHHTFLSLPAKYFEGRKTIIFTHHKPPSSGLSRKFLPLGPRQSPGIEIVGEGGSIEAIQPPSPTTQSRELSRGSKWQEFTGKTTSLPNQSFVSSIPEFLSLKGSFKDLYVIGGAQIYSLFFQENLIQEFILTKLKKDYDGDTFFPLSLLNGWAEHTIRETADFTIHRYFNPQDCTCT